MNVISLSLFHDLDLVCQLTVPAKLAHLKASPVQLAEVLGCFGQPVLPASLCELLCNPALHPSSSSSAASELISIISNVTDACSVLCSLMLSSLPQSFRVGTQKGRDLSEQSHTINQNLMVGLILVSLTTIKLTEIRSTYLIVFHFAVFFPLNSPHVHLISNDVFLQLCSLCFAYLSVLSRATVQYNQSSQLMAKLHNAELIILYISKTTQIPKYSATVLEKN